MTPNSESQTYLEATRSTTIICTRTTINIGTWNVRTMVETGKTAQVAAKMRQYNLELLGIGEAVSCCCWATRKTTRSGSDVGQDTQSGGKMVVVSRGGSPASNCQERASGLVLRDPG